jgi:tetratricopeptide (TPR) repeat protein
MELPPAELEDVKKVDAAIAALGAKDVATAERLLHEVVARTPPDYWNEREVDGTLYLKLWTKEDFLCLAMRDQAAGRARKVVWLFNAYPRAHHYLACVRLERGDLDGAIAACDAGLRLEPESGQLMLEKSCALRVKRDFEGALALAAGVVNRPERHLPRILAAALRAMGVCMIGLDRLDEAEIALQGSLTLDPDSGFARNELRYIGQLRLGGERAPMGAPQALYSPPVACARCGGPPPAKGKVTSVPAGAGVSFLCRRCERAGLPWWQFWKYWS